MAFPVIDVEQIKEDIKILDSESLIEKYNLLREIKRKTQIGITENLLTFTNGQYINLIVKEIKKRNLKSYLSKWDLLHI